MRSSEDRINAGLLAALVVIAIIGIAAIASLQQLTRTSAEAARARAAFDEIESLLEAVAEAADARRDFVRTGDPRDVAAYEQAAERVAQDIADLRAAEHVEPGQAAVLVRVARHSAQWLALGQGVIAMRRVAGTDSAQALMDRSRDRAIMDSIQVAGSAFREAGLRALEASERREDRHAMATTLIVMASSLFALAMVLLCALQLRRHHAERKRAERTLRESETLLSQFMENLPIGVIIVDTAWQQRFANIAAVELLGPGLLIESGPRQLPLLRLGDGEPFPEGETPLALALAGQAAVAEDAGVMLDGQCIPVRVSAAPVYDARGQIAYAIAAFERVTQPVSP